MPAIIEVKYFNSFILAKTVDSAGDAAWRYTPGLVRNDEKNWFIEESRITGGYNNTSVDFGAKAYLVSERNNASIRSNSMIYSGVYNSRTGVNNTNQFSVAEDISRSADPNYGSIQKLYAEDTNLTIFQENKVSRALIDKDAIYSAEGAAVTTSGAQVIGQIQAYAGEWGISKDPRSFAVYGYQKYFTDRNNNAVLRLSSDGITEISSYGMKYFFTKALSTLGEGKIISGYDVVDKSYILSLQSAQTGAYNTLAFDETINGWTSFYDYKPSNIFSINSNYYTIKGSSLYKHNQAGLTSNNRGVFYGVRYPAKVTLILNSDPSVSKVFKTINYEGSNGWETTAVYTAYDYGNNILSYNEGAYDSADPQNEGAAAVVHPIYHAGFNRKENKFFANIINNSFATDGEVVYGNSMSGIKGFFSTVTMQTDNSTELGKFKELYAVSSEYIESSY
jgi:hypothetical protein